MKREKKCCFYISQNEYLQWFKYTELCKEEGNARTDKESRLVHSSPSCQGLKKNGCPPVLLIPAIDTIKFSFIVLDFLKDNQTPFKLDFLESPNFSWNILYEADDRDVSELVWLIHSFTHSFMLQIFCEHLLLEGTPPGTGDAGNRFKFLTLQKWHF